MFNKYSFNCSVFYKFKSFTIKILNIQFCIFPYNFYFLKSLKSLKKIIRKIIFLRNNIT